MTLKTLELWGLAPSFSNFSDFEFLTGQHFSDFGLRIMVRIRSNPTRRHRKSNSWPPRLERPRRRRRFFWICMPKSRFLNDFVGTNSLGLGELSTLVTLELLSYLPNRFDFRDFRAFEFPSPNFKATAGPCCCYCYCSAGLLLLLFSTRPATPNAMYAAATLPKSARSAIFAGFSRF